MTARFSGPQGKGAMRAHRALKRAQAQERSANVPCERTRAHNRPHGHAYRVCGCLAAPVESVAVAV